MQEFNCQRCGACCRIPDGIVRVSNEEIRAMADFLDGTCCFYREREGCLVHPAKPLQCRTFPFRWHNPDSFSLCPALRELQRQKTNPTP